LDNLPKLTLRSDLMVRWELGKPYDIHEEHIRAP
jgi:hypothetical protein